MKRLLILYILFSFITIFIFVRQFNYSTAVIIGHTFFCFLIHGFFILLSYLFLKNMLVKKAWFIIYFSFYFTLWALFYVLIFVSNAEWGDTVYLSMAWRYIKNLPEVLDYFQYNSAFYILVIGLYLIMVSGFHYFIFLEKKTAVKNVTLFDVLKRKRTGSVMLISLLLVAGIFVSGIGIIRAKRYFHSKGEPIFKFYSGYMWGNEKEEYYSLEQLNINKVENAARNKFINTAGSVNHRNIILMVIDGLRADNLHAYGYPEVTTP